MSQKEEQGLEQNAIENNLQLIEEEIETSSQYFKPKPGKTAVIRKHFSLYSILLVLRQLDS